MRWYAYVDTREEEAPAKIFAPSLHPCYVNVLSRDKNEQTAIKQTNKQLEDKHVSGSQLIQHQWLPAVSALSICFTAWFSKDGLIVLQPGVYLLFDCLSW